MKVYIALPQKVSPLLDFSGAKTAEDVFRIANLADPDRFAELVARLPTSSTPDDDFRHQFGYRRPHRKSGEVTRHVPIEMQRIFSDEEWANIENAWQQGELEHNAIERIAHELAAEGMRGY